MESKVIHTAEEFFDDYAKEHLDCHSWNDFICRFDENYVEEKTFEVAVLFARHHVSEALKEAERNAEIGKLSSGITYLNSDSILNAYKEDLIK